MPLLGTDSVVTRAYKPLLSVGCRRNSVDRVTRSSAEGDHLGSKHDAGITMDRRKFDEVQGVEHTHGGIDTRYRLQQETRVV